MSYPQMPPLKQDEIGQLLENARLARICSLNEDGTIHAATVWFIYENGVISISTHHINRKARNIRRNNKVTLLIDQESSPPRGVLIYGTASLDYDDITEKRTHIYEKYVPKEEARELAERLSQEKFTPVIIKVTPNRFISYDFAKEQSNKYKGVLHG